MKIKMFSRIKLRLVICFFLLSQILFTLSKPQKKKIKLLLNQNFLIQDEEIRKTFTETTLLPLRMKKINSTISKTIPKSTIIFKTTLAPKLTTIFKSTLNSKTTINPKSTTILKPTIILKSTVIPKLTTNSIVKKISELTTKPSNQIEENFKELNNQTNNINKTNIFIEDQTEVTVSTMVKILNENKLKNYNNIQRRILSRDQWLAKEYFSYLCASDFCLNSETKDKILNSCFTKNEQLNQLINKCLIKGRCDSQIQTFNCVLNEKDSLLIPWISIHDCVDGLVSMRTWKCIRREQLMSSN